MAKTGQMDRQTYEPGVKRPEQKPIEEGRYRLVLQKPGKKGRDWRKKDPKSFPYKRLLFKAIDREGNTVQDEATGQDAMVSSILSSSPKAFFTVYDLAYAAGYPEKFSLPEVVKSDDPKVEERCKMLDQIVDFIEENEIALNAFVTEGEHNGRPQNDIRWEAPDDETAEAESEDEEAEESEEKEETEESSEDTESEDDEDEDADEDEDEDTEEEVDHSPKKPSKPAPKAPAKPVKKGKKSGK